MGMFRAVGSVYANMFNFSGRARRAEYWWFVLFTYLVMFAIQGGLVYWLFNDPAFGAAMSDPAAIELYTKRYQEQMWDWGLYGLVATVFLYWLPQLAVTVRRLHDTGRSGWWMFKPILVGLALTFAMMMAAVSLGGTEPSAAIAIMAALVPTIASLWFLVVLCLPGTHGDNRFGPDPIEGREPQAPGRNIASVKAMDEHLGRHVQQQNRQEFQDYYRARVLPAIERNKARRTAQ